MVGIVTSAGLGLQRSSLWVLGSQGQLGDAAFGRYGEQVYVNADTGNLMIDRTDEILIGRGLDDVISRGYNSLSANQGYMAHNGWQISDSRCITGLTGTVNAAGSTVTRISSDGSDTLYKYDTTQNAYICTQNGNAEYRLTFNTGNGLWTWTDAKNNLTENYDSNQGGRLNWSKDSDGNKLSYAYDASSGLLTSVTTDNGEVTSLTWGGRGNLTSITTSATDANGNPITLTRVNYTYDSSNRLKTVTTDLSPQDNSITDGNKVVTTYTYDGTSDRVASITQTGGAELDITYQVVDGTYRVASLTQTVATGVTRTTNFSYDTDNSVTTVTDSNGQSTQITYGTKGQITKLVLPPAQAGGTAETISYTYNNPNQDEATSKDADGDTTTYLYDTNDNLISVTDPLGNVVSYTYDTANHVLTETHTPGAGQAGQTSTIRYTYDAEEHLRYVVTADGGVTEHQYNRWGQRTATINYRDNAYNLHGLGDTESISEDRLNGWVSGITDQSTVERTDVTHDVRGDVATTTTYSACLSTGAGDTSKTYTTVTYVYDQAGKLLSRETSGIANSDVYTYDGLGRMQTATDLNGGTTTVAWDDGTNTCTVTLDNGLVETSVYDKAGELISYAKSGLAASTYKYDSLGRLTVSTDSTGRSMYFLYDNLGRKVADVAADGSMREYKYDPDGNLVATVAYATKLTSTQLNTLATGSDPDLGTIRPSGASADVWSWQIYDADNRLIETIDGDGDVTTFSYDNDSNLIATTSYYKTLTSTQISGFKTTPPVLHTMYLPTATSGKDETTRNFYDNESRLIGVLNGDGYLSQIKYNQAGEKTETIAYATITSSTHWASGSFATLLADAGSTAQDIHENYVYDDRGLLRYTIDPNLRPTEFVYDKAGNLLEKIDYAGNIAAPPSYTAANVATAITNAGLASNSANRKSWQVYDVNTGNLAYSIDAAGGVAQYKYDDLGRAVKQTQFLTARTTSSNPSQSTMDTWATANANTHDRITRSIYDIDGRLVYTVDPESYVTEYRYDASDRVTLSIRYADQYSVDDSVTQSSLKTLIGSTIPSTAVQTSYSYDSNGRLTDTIDDSGGLAIDTRVAYDALGRMTDKTVAYGTQDAATAHYTYDTANRVVTEVLAYGAPEAATTTYTYDGMGNVLTRKDARSNITTYTYDALGQILTTTVPLDSTTNAVTTNTYDAFGNLSTQQDANLNTTYFYYDLLNRLTLQVDPGTYATGTSYTIGNEIASVTRYYTAVSGTIHVGIPPTVTVDAAHDSTTTFTRDNLGRVTQVTDAENYYEKYTLDAFGDRVSVRNKLGGTTTNTFDHRGLLLSEVLPETSRDADWNLESSTVTNTYTYDARGNLTQKVEAAGLAEQRTTKYTHDHLDRLTLTTGDTVQTVAADLKTITQVAPTTKIKYDARGDVIETDDPNGARTLSYYDDLGRKIATVNALGTMTAWTYDGNGNVLTQKVYGDAVTLPGTPGGTPPDPVDPNNYRLTTNVYDKNNRLATSTVKSLLTGEYNTTTSTYSTTTQDVTTTYTYDAMGNLVQQTDDRGNSIYSWYNKLGQKICEIDQDNYFNSWAYDANGNVTIERRRAHVYTGTISLDTPPSGDTGAYDRVTDFTYDRNGRRLTETRLGVADASVNATTGALTTNTEDATVTYTYNGLGEVLTKTEATGDETVYGYDLMGRQTTIDSAAFYTDADGNPTVQTHISYVYDGLNDMVREGVENAGTGHWRITRNYMGAGGRLDHTIDASTFEKDYGYDAAGNIVKVSYSRLKSDGSTVTEAQATQYDKLGRVTQESIATYDSLHDTWTLGDKIQTQYDVYGEVSARGVNGIWQQTYAYDSAGRMWKSTDEGITKLYIYDAAGNQSLQITTDGNTLPSGYSWSSITLAQAISLLTAGGHSIGTQDVPGMVVTATAYDERGQATQVTEFRRQLAGDAADGYTIADITTKRAYNAFGEVSEDTDARGHITDYSYNSEGKITLEQLPTVAYTDETGAAYNARPTQTNYYDISGRLIGVMDANGRLNTRVLLAGTGYDGSDAMVTDEFHADGGHLVNTYDAFGELTQTQNELGNVETFAYDAMGRLYTDTHQLRSDGTQLIDSYRYDGLGQRIQHWNSQLGSGVKDTTDYDAQGRVVKEVDMGGNTTTYGYSWSSSAATTGLGTYGGWIKTTVNTAGLTATETDDVDGRTIAKTNYGGTNYTYSYDLAGQLKERTNDYQDSGLMFDSGEVVDYDYFNTGLIASVDTGYSTRVWIPPRGGDPGYYWGSTDDITATYSYDGDSNRLTESTVHSWTDALSGDTDSATEETATATYDALNRLASLNETIDDDASTMTWKYDLNGNVRERYSTYYTLDANGNVTSTKGTQDDWYLYDAMNRFTLVKGSLVSGAIVADSDSTTLAYDAAGERKTAKNGVDGTTETYIYTEDGYLSQVKVGSTKRADYTRDAMGRVTLEDEYDTNGITILYSEASTYNSKSQLTDQTVTDVRSDGKWVWTTHYDYKADSNGDGDYTDSTDQYMGGVVTHEHTTATKDSVAQPTSDTINYYTWWDSAQQSYTDYTPDTSHPGTVYATDYNYDKRGYLTDASISDGAPRDIAYTNGVNGEILENNDNKSSSPATKFFWFDGIQRGDVSNDGTSDTDYVQSIAQHTTKPGTGFFQNGATTPTAYADFDASYDPINGLDSHETPATRYTVSQGDTLESIAQAVWGDANFWYLIADANGIQSDDQLVSGMDLIIPDKVANASNSSSTFRVYDPNLALGNTSPTHPPKPQSHHGGCGVVGEVLLAVVAVAVTVVTAGAAVAALTPGMSLIGGMGAFVTGSAVADVGVAGMVGIGAAAGAAGSIASQGIGVATGLQSKFNWGAVGLAAVGGAVGGGLQAVGAFSDMAESIGSFGVGALRGITGSLITQGIGVATGLQSKFDWAGVAAAGVGSGVGNWVGSELNGVDYGFGDVLNKATTRLVSGMAGDIANAASRTLVNGSDFGDNILLALPSTIVQTVGAAYADYENQVQATNGLDGDLTGATKTTPVDVSELPPVVDSEGATPDAAPATTAVSNPQQANATSNLAGTSSGDSLIEPAGANGPVLSRSDQIIAATAAGYSAEQIATSIDSGLHFVPNAEGSGSWLDGSNVETVIVTSPPSHPGAWGGTAWALDYISKAIDGGQASRAAVLSVLKIGASPVERRLFNIMVSSLDKRLGVASYALTVASDFASAQASIQAGADPAEAYAHAAGHSGASISGGIIGGLIGGAAAGPPGAVIGAALGSEAPDVHIPDEVKILFPALLIPDIVQASADDLGAYLKSKGW